MLDNNGDKTTEEKSLMNSIGFLKSKSDALETLKDLSAELLGKIKNPYPEPISAEKKSAERESLKNPDLMDLLNDTGNTMEESIRQIRMDLEELLVMIG